MRRPMPRGEKLFKLLAGLMLDRFYGTDRIRFEARKVTQVETETRQMWQYKDLPEEMLEPSGKVGDGETVGASTRGPMRKQDNQQLEA